MKTKLKKSIILFAIFIFSIILISSNKMKETDKSGEATILPGEISDGTITQDHPGSVQALMEMRDISSQELVKEITIGWNLGNTMDATGGMGVLSETSWENPKTTQAMIDTVSAAGFDILRIPVTWQSHIGPSPDYIIDEDWLGRVQEIVDYAYANDMFVIINMHHEEWYCPYYATADTVINKFKTIWKQIADHFENYDEHLIFEAMNEPRQIGTKNEWGSGDQECWDVINRLNTAFVDTIRSASGNNPLRHLMITTYANNTSQKVLEGFLIPKDNKIIVSAHVYIPYDFTLNKKGTSEWSVSKESDTGQIDYKINSLYNSLISKGIPVIIDEFGTLNKNNTDRRAAWSEYFVKAATKKGIPCIWWDNGNEETFCLLNRLTLTWSNPEIVKALMRGLE